MIEKFSNNLGIINNYSSFGEAERTWLTINLTAFSENVRSIKKFIGKPVNLLAMVKGQAYGIGNPTDVAKLAIANGADVLGVELIEEAVELRKEGINDPIVMVGPISSFDATNVVNFDIQPTIRDHETLNVIERLASSQGKEVPVHLELETGLNRFGNSAKEVFSLAYAIQEMKAVSLKGMWTHFTSAEQPQDNHTQIQFDKYVTFLAELRDQNISIPTKHICNSAALLRYRNMHLDMVRCGKLLYGFEVVPGLSLNFNLQNVISWKSKICKIRVLNRGDTTSYGRIWVAENKVPIGIINVGFGDGYPTSLSNRSNFLIHGKRVPLIGRICMSAMMIDLSNAPQTLVGDEVVLIGEQGDEKIALEELSTKSDALPAEFLLGISQRVPRFYKMEKYIVRSPV